MRYRWLSVRKIKSLPATAPDQPVWMSHSDTITLAPPGFSAAASTDATPVAVLEDGGRAIFGLQFHPEVAHTPGGQEILERFLFESCRTRPSWTMSSVIETEVASR